MTSTNKIKQGFHRMGSHYGRFLDRDRFLGRDIWSDNWIAPKGHTYANIMEQRDVYVIEIIASGFKRKELSVSIQDHLLTVRGQKEESKFGEINYVKREYDTDSFTRKFELTDNVDLEKIKARLENGLLKIRLGKSTGKFATLNKRTIPIN